MKKAKALLTLIFSEIIMRSIIERDLSGEPVSIDDADYGKIKKNHCKRKAADAGNEYHGLRCGDCA